VSGGAVTDQSLAWLEPDNGVPPYSALKRKNLPVRSGGITLHGSQAGADQPVPTFGVGRVRSYQGKTGEPFLGNMSSPDKPDESLPLAKNSREFPVLILASARELAIRVSQREPPAFL
jgi:hypothetical protein